MIEMEMCITLTSDECEDTIEESWQSLGHESQANRVAMNTIQDLKNDVLREGWQLIDGQFICDYCVAFRALR